jgi:hypothetical protein
MVDKEKKNKYHYWLQQTKKQKPATWIKIRRENQFNISKERSYSYLAKEMDKTKLNLCKKSYVWLNVSLWSILRNHFPLKGQEWTFWRARACYWYWIQPQCVIFEAVTVVTVCQCVCSPQISNWPWNNSTQLLIYTLWLWVCILNIQHLKIYAYTYKHTNPASYSTLYLNGLAAAANFPSPLPKVSGVGFMSQCLSQNRCLSLGK